MANLSKPITSSQDGPSLPSGQEHEADETYAEDGVVAAFAARAGMLSPYVGLLIAWVATCGSLFFSEVLGWLPCVLCWYQRILMYPLALILTIGILRRDERLHLYVLPFSLLGACISLYHYLLVKTDWLPPPPCVAGIPCTVEYLNWLGFINIPFLALTAFLLISFMMAISSLMSEDDIDNSNTAPELHVRQGHAVVVPIIVFGIISVVIGSFVIAARFV